MRAYIITTRSEMPVEIFKSPMVVPNPKFPSGSQAREDNKMYVYSFFDRIIFHDAIYYMIDHGVEPIAIKWTGDIQPPKP